MAEMALQAALHPVRMPTELCILIDPMCLKIRRLAARQPAARLLAAAAVRVALAALAEMLWVASLVALASALGPARVLALVLDSILQATAAMAAAAEMPAMPLQETALQVLLALVP